MVRPVYLKTDTNYKSNLENMNPSAPPLDDGIATAQDVSANTIIVNDDAITKLIARERAKIEREAMEIQASETKRLNDARIKNEKAIQEETIAQMKRKEKVARETQEREDAKRLERQELEWVKMNPIPAKIRETERIKRIQEIQEEKDMEVRRQIALNEAQVRRQIELNHASAVNDQLLAGVRLEEKKDTAMLASAVFGAMSLGLAVYSSLL